MKPLETGMKCKMVVSAYGRLMLEGPENNLDKTHVFWLLASPYIGVREIGQYDISSPPLRFSFEFRG